MDGLGAFDRLSSNPFLSSIAASMIDDFAAVTDDLIRRLTQEDPFYASASDTMGPEIREATVENLSQFLQSLGGSRTTTFGLTRQLARRRAEQGVPVASLLHAYRLAAQVVLDHIVVASVAWSEREGGNDQIMAGIVDLFPLVNIYSDVISQAYQDEATDRARRSERERTLLLDALIEGRTQDLPLVAEAARILDLPERGQLMIVVAETGSPGDEGLPGIEQALRAVAIRSAWRLRTRRQIGIVALGSEHSGADRAGQLRQLLGSRSVGRVGLSPVFDELVDAARFVALADIALSCVRPGTADVAVFDDHPMATLVVGSPELADRMACTVLGPVLALPPREQQQLLTTMSAWITEGGSTRLASDHLGCHRNTVRNRLQRVEALTGRSLEDPKSLAEICLAVEALNLRGPAEPPPDPGAYQSRRA